MSNPDRFLGRADVYAAARPGYPQALSEWLVSQRLLDGHVADVGAGTGLFTRLLLTHGGRVAAVEPNPEMRSQLATSLEASVQTGQLTVLAGTSEDTGIPEASVALVTAAQAAHWFEPEATLREFRRILCPGGRVLFVWNDWRGVETPFNRAYGAVVARYQDARTPQLATRVPEAELPRFMPGGVERRVFDNPVILSRERLRALAGSVSYLPAPGDARSGPMFKELDQAFDAHAQGGQVTLAYRTHAFLGQLD
ncbi:methyltransferase type 11 [Deinococcus malanensis]|uniref:Methyltransferase type 11 n=1 Tax=Deinococcus malanensis TaxID=1706855 RepID=A0ABQ2EMI3_9DEIO|nr:class I SAM-dependent methyltransferase [Deinococcus malanensis]GGK14592.1 methyltransferase type 11 [Deinococcus malanensis]